MGSPFFGVGYFSAMIGETRGPAYPFAAGAALFWSLAYAAVAGVLLAATLATFDLCLGRVSAWDPQPELAALGWREPTPLEEVVFLDRWDRPAPSPGT